MENSSPVVLSLEHREALRIIVQACDALGVRYRAADGLAGNVHGSTWPLHDIDLDYRSSEWPVIAKALDRYLVDGLHAYFDFEFKLTMASARIGKVDIGLYEYIFVMERRPPYCGAAPRHVRTHISNQ